MLILSRKQSSLHDLFFIFELWTRMNLENTRAGLIIDWQKNLRSSADRSSHRRASIWRWQYSRWYWPTSSPCSFTDRRIALDRRVEEMNTTDNGKAGLVGGLGWEGKSGRRKSWRESAIVVIRHSSWVSLSSRRRRTMDLIIKIASAVTQRFRFIDCLNDYQFSQA